MWGKRETQIVILGQHFMLATATFASATLRFCKSQSPNQHGLQKILSTDLAKIRVQRRPQHQHSPVVSVPQQSALVYGSSSPPLHWHLTSPPSIARNLTVLDLAPVFRIEVVTSANFGLAGPVNSSQRSFSRLQWIITSL